MVMTMDPHVASCGILWLSFFPLLLIPLTQAQISATNPAQFVHLPLGAVAGIPCPLHPAVTQYLGLPFAQAPVNDLRFRPPLPYSTRYPSPVLNAIFHPPACGNRCGKTPMPEDIKFSSEDCLYLNVWVPPGAHAGGRLPVRVYIHGGMPNHCSASDAQTDGCAFTAAVGSIQVNIQFRTGAFGMLAHPATWQESNTTGNWALLDQQLALKWVKNHIGAFGGDPSRILLFGNSAGGRDVDFHMVAPGSRGLFSAAIAQSPACAKFITLEQSYRVGDRLLSQTGCSSHLSPSHQLACLRSVPWHTLFLGTALQPGALLGVYLCEGEVAWDPSFHPCVDGTVIPQQRMEAIIDGNFNRVPYLGGHTSGEGFSFAKYFWQNKSLAEDAASTLSSLISTVYPGADSALVANLYDKKDKEESQGHGSPSLSESPDHFKLAHLWTDFFFTCPMRATLAARQRHLAPTWHFWFTSTPSCPASEIELRSRHTAELFSVFGLKENLPPPSGGCSMTQAEMELSDLMMSAWHSMAVTSTPRFSLHTDWPQWTPETNFGAEFSAQGSSVRPIDQSEVCDALEVARVQSRAFLTRVGGRVTDRNGVVDLSSM